MEMKKNISVFFKAFSIIAAIAIVFAALVLTVYLKVLPAAVSNQNVINYVKEFVKESTGAELVLEKPVLKTELSPQIGFKFDKLALSKDKKELLCVEKFDIKLSFAEVLDHKIILKNLTLDSVFADANGLMTLAPQQEQKKEQVKSDWRVYWFDSLLSLKKCEILYDLDKDTHIKINGSDMLITSTKEPKFIRFNLAIDVNKGKHNIKIGLDDRNRVCIKDRKLIIDKALLGINDSRVYIDAYADKDNNVSLTVYSKDFSVKNAAELLESNIVVPNGAEMLSFFKDFNGSFNFKINLTNNDINGVVKLNNGSLKIIPMANLPVVADGGLIKISKNDVVLSDFKGWYGTNRRNSFVLGGTVKDYTKSVDTNIEITGVATNDLTQNYLSKLVGCKITLTGDSGAKIIVKSKYSIVDMTMMFKVAKGKDILIEGASLSPVNYDRAVVADLHLDGNLLNIKSIRYFIAKELNKETKNVRPILTIDGNMDIATLQVKNIGFNIPKPLPSEFLNVLIGQKLFKKGTISGNMQVVFPHNIPKLMGNLEMDKVLVPSQRLSIKKASMKTDRNLIKLDAQGRFKRSEYNFKGYIKNELVFPIVIKDINLTVDNIDVEKILLSMNNQNASAVNAQNHKAVTADALAVKNSSDENNDDAYTFNTGLLIIERCILHVIKGNYKELNFGNLYANLTLDNKGVLQIKSNKFDFAEGISSLKVYCDLMKHKYNLTLGVKDINSDLIATTMLALNKEISGKAKGLIDIYTDDTLKLNGKILFEVEDGTIQKVGLVQYALNFASLFRNPLAMISPSTLVDLVNVPEGRFKSINGSLIIKNNIVEKIMIKSSAPQLSSFIVGRYDLETGDATLRIYTKFSSKNKGFAGFLRNISLNSLANRVSLGTESEANYYALELEQLPPLEADEKDCQVFLTKVDGDVQNFNFLSSLKKIK